MIHSRPAICPSAPIPMANPSMNSDRVETAVKDIEVLEVVLGYGWIRDDMGMELSNYVGCIGISEPLVFS